MGLLPDHWRTDYICTIQGETGTAHNSGYSTPYPILLLIFAKTIGGLYYQHKDYTNLINKKLNFFLEFVRSHYYLDTNTINEKTASDLSAKSGKPLAETKALLEYIIYLKNKGSHSEQDVIALNKKIAAFKQ